MLQALILQQIVPKIGSIWCKQGGITLIWSQQLQLPPPVQVFWLQEAANQTNICLKEIMDELMCYTKAYCNINMDYCELLIMQSYSRRGQD